MSTFLPRHPTDHGRPRLAAAALIAITLLSGACGNDAPATAASDGAPAETEFAESREPTEAEITRMLEEWRDCMLAELPADATVDVSPDGGVSVDSDGDGGDTDRAEELCNPLIADLERSFAVDPEQAARERDQTTAVIECVRAQGYEDPPVGMIVNDSGGLDISINVSEGAIFDEEAYLAVESQCFEEAGLDGEGG